MSMAMRQAVHLFAGGAAVPSIRTAAVPVAARHFAPLAHTTTKGLGVRTFCSAETQATEQKEVPAQAVRQELTPFQRLLKTARFETRLYFEPSRGSGGSLEAKTHEREMHVKMKIQIEEIQKAAGLDEDAMHRMELICGLRIQKQNGVQANSFQGDILTLTSQDYPIMEANRQNVIDRLEAIIRESKHGDWCPAEAVKELEATKKKKLTWQESMSKDWVLDSDEEFVHLYMNGRLANSD